MFSVISFSPPPARKTSVRTRTKRSNIAKNPIPRNNLSGDQAHTSTATGLPAASSPAQQVHLHSKSPKTIGLNHHAAQCEVNSATGACLALQPRSPHRPLPKAKDGIPARDLPKGLAQRRRKLTQAGQRPASSIANTSSNRLGKSGEAGVEASVEIY